MLEFLIYKNLNSSEQHYAQDFIVFSAMLTYCYCA